MGISLEVWSLLSVTMIPQLPETKEVTETVAPFKVTLAIPPHILDMENVVEGFPMSVRANVWVWLILLKISAIGLTTSPGMVAVSICASPKASVNVAVHISGFSTEKLILALVFDVKIMGLFPENEKSDGATEQLVVMFTGPI